MAGAGLGAIGLAIGELLFLWIVGVTVSVPMDRVQPAVQTAARVMVAGALPSLESRAVSAMRPPLEEKMHAIFQSARFRIDGVSIPWPAPARRELERRVERQLNGLIAAELSSSASATTLISPSRVREVMRSLEGLSVVVHLGPVPVRVRLHWVSR